MVPRCRGCRPSRRTATTPAAASFLSEGTGREGEPVLIIAMPASASAAITGSTSAGSGWPRQKAWLITTRPCHPQRAGALDDQLGREQAELAGLVQMDVDGLAMLLGHAEHRIEMPLRVAVDRARVEPADDVRAHRERLVEHLERARADEQPALREGDDLDRAEVAHRLARREDALDAFEAALPGR